MTTDTQLERGRRGEKARNKAQYTKKKTIGGEIIGNVVGIEKVDARSKSIG